MKKLSVIVPCYNVEKYIGRCLESLVTQNSSDFVAIVIDDGSTDNTGEIIKQYQSKYPDLIQFYTKKNEGIASARNFGLSKVETEYFGFLDSDDYAKCDMVSSMLNKAYETDAEIVVSNFKWVFEYKEGKDYIQKEGPYNCGKESIVDLFATLWNKIYKTETIRKIGITFPDGYRYEDASFLYRLMPHISKIQFIDDDYVSYVQREGSITHTHNEKVKDMVYVFEGIISYYKNNNFYSYYRDELEFIFIRFFLGNSFLRTIQIKDKNDRKLTLELSWDVLNRNFPDWKKNKYINNTSLRNLYYKTINKHNYYIYAYLFDILLKIKN